MVYIVHHSADLDGFFSGLITAKGIIAQNSRAKIKFVPYNYQESVDVYENGEYLPLQDVVEHDDEIYFVDCSYTKDLEVMKEICEKASSVTLIDHHESAIEWCKNNNLKIDYSYSKNSSDPALDHPESAASLCWKTFFGFDPIPKIIELISDYDIWYKGNGKWETETLPFQFGMRNKDINMGRIFDYIDDFDDLFDDDYSTEYIKGTISEGKAIIKYQKARSKMVLKSTGFPAKLHVGPNESYYAYFGADYCANSTLFEWGLEPEEYAKYDIFVLCRPTIGSEKSYISIISNKDEINACEICGKFGGGGHKTISGCVVNITKTPCEDGIFYVTFEEAQSR